MKWLTPNEESHADRELSVDEVKALEIGNRVIICGEDKEGHPRTLACTVAGLPQKKFLTYRDEHGSIKKCPIKEYPGKHYKKPIGG